MRQETTITESPEQVVDAFHVFRLRRAHEDSLPLVDRLFG
jgi:hypothetical protein